MTSQSRIETTASPDSVLITERGPDGAVRSRASVGEQAPHLPAGERLDVGVLTIADEYAGRDQAVDESFDPDDPSTAVVAGVNPEVEAERLATIADRMVVTSDSRHTGVPIQRRIPKQEGYESIAGGDRIEVSDSLTLTAVPARTSLGEGNADAVSLSDVTGVLIEGPDRAELYAAEDGRTAGSKRFARYEHVAAAALEHEGYALGDIAAFHGPNAGALEAEADRRATDRLVDEFDPEDTDRGTDGGRGSR